MVAGPAAPHRSQPLQHGESSHIPVPLCRLRFAPLPSDSVQVGRCGVYQEKAAPSACPPAARSPSLRLHGYCTWGASVRAGMRPPNTRAGCPTTAKAPCAGQHGWLQGLEAELGGHMPWKSLPRGGKRRAGREHEAGGGWRPHAGLCTHFHFCLSEPAGELQHGTALLG